MVKSINSVTDNCSGLLSKIVSSLKLSLKLICFKLFLMVFLLCWKESLTIFKNNFSSQFMIDNRLIGDKQPVYIIAEAGVSHFGSEEKAFKLVDLAVESGADAIKFQTSN